MKWKDFEQHLVLSQKDLYVNRQFTDVTLVSDDLVQFPSHRTVLAEASPVLRPLLQINFSGSPVLFLKGIKSYHLEKLLEFVYLGEASVDEDTEIEVQKMLSDLEIIQESNIKFKLGIETSNATKLQKLDFLSYENENECNFQGEDYSHVRENESQEIGGVDEQKYFNDDINTTLEEDLNFTVKTTVNENQDTMTCEGTRPKLEEPKIEQMSKGKGNKVKKSKRKPEEPAECSDCNIKFTTKRSFQRHWNVIHELKFVSCDECGKQLRGRDALKTHRQALHMEKVYYECDKCHKKFTIRKSLGNHKREVHLKCLFHDISFMTDLEMDTHLKEEHTNKYL